MPAALRYAAAVAMPLLAERASQPEGATGVLPLRAAHTPDAAY